MLASSSVLLKGYFRFILRSWIAGLKLENVSIDKLVNNTHCFSFFTSFTLPYLDDGSSTYLCWTSGERAFTFLRVHEELPEDAIDVDQWIRSDSSRSTTAYHLEKIVWVHKRIVIKVNGSQNDALFQNLTIDVASQQLLAESEDNFLKWLILNATSGPMWVRSSSLIWLCFHGRSFSQVGDCLFPLISSFFWLTQDVTASSMDMKMIQHVEREQCVEMEASGLTRRNVWGNEICQVDTLVRAWSLLQGLLITWSSVFQNNESARN